MVSHAQPALQVIGLAKRFRDQAGKRIDVLEHVDLTVRPGVLTVIEGAPGAGRTTLLRCLYRTHVPDRGRMYLTAGGMCMELAAARPMQVSWARRCHVRLFDGSLAVPDRATGHAVLVRALRRTSLTAAIAERRAVNALSRAGISPDRPVRLLSEAERRFIAVLLALLPEASVVLLDEPSVPDEHGAALLTLIAEACQRGAAVVATAPVGSDLAAGADQVLLLQQGRVMEVSRSGASGRVRNLLA